MNFTPLSEFFITMSELPSQQEVQDWTDSQNQSFDHDRWIVPCLVLGSFLLVASGMVLILLGAMR